MHASLDKSAQLKKWTYASLSLIDGNRRLKPTHVSFNKVCFAEPPRLVSNHVQIIISNGDEVQQRDARVLPHGPDETRIPIELIET